MVAKRFTVTVHRKGAKNAKEYLKEENKTFNSFPNHVLMEMGIVWECNGIDNKQHEPLHVAVPSGLKPRYDMYSLTPALRLGLMPVLSLSK